MRNECGVCVPTALCYRRCECKSPDLEEIRCVNECSVHSCSNAIDEEVEKCDADYCAKTCDCKSGYARNRFGECVPESECEEEIEPTH